MDTQLILMGAVGIAALTLVLHLIRESRATVAITASLIEALETAAPVIVLIILSTSFQALFDAFNLNRFLDFTDKIANTAYYSMIANGMCLANIRLTPVVSVYYDEASAKINVFTSILSNTFTLAKFFGPFIQIIIYVSEAFVAIGPFFYFLPGARRIGAFMIGFAMAQTIGLAVYSHSIVQGLYDKIGQVDIEPGPPAKVKFDSTVCKSAEFTAAPVYAVGCDNTIREFMTCQIDVYASYNAWTELYMLIMGLVVPVATGLLARH